MFDIIFLGTSASAPSIHRGLSAQVILAGEHRFLVDCGEGTQRQILRSGIGFKKLNHILLTHAHLDHILGLGGLISTFIRWESMDEVIIWGGRQTLERVHTLLFQVVFPNQKLSVPIHMIELETGLIFEGKDFTVSAFPVTHRGGGNFGFVFEEKPHRPFLAEKAAELGIPAGPERSQLVRGESITLPGGEIITPDMVLGDEIRGARLVHVGDTGRIDNLYEYAAGADALVIESTFLEIEAETARQFGHITARQAATLAKESGVRTLLLTHISRRYRESDIRQEARAIFENTFVARDLEQYSIRRDGTTKKTD
jgi:ribonuclease Z